MKRTLKYWLFVVGIIFLTTGCFNKLQEEVPKNREEPQKYELSMIMAGDALIHSSVYKDAYQGSDIYNFNYMFEELKPIVKNHDLAFYNQETIIGGKGLGLSTYPRFNSPEEIGDALIDAGFNMISLANNHTLDRGEQAVINSLNYWQNKDVAIAGSYRSFDEKNNVVIKQKNNIRYALLAYTMSTNGIPCPTGKEYLVNLYSDTVVKQDVDKIKDYTDVIIVSMHWGNEYTHTPTDEQRRIAGYLSSIGVNVVIGHHPHVIEPIEYIGDTLVVYSLGNLVSAQIGTPRLIGMLVSLNIVKSTDKNQVDIEIKDVKGDLVYTYYNNRFRNFKVIPFSNLNDDLLNNYKDIEQQYSAIINKYDKTIKYGIFK